MQVSFSVGNWVSKRSLKKVWGDELVAKSHNINRGDSLPRGLNLGRGPGSIVNRCLRVTPDSSQRRDHTNNPARSNIVIPNAVSEF
jgi:hypothetical protein